MFPTTYIAISFLKNTHYQDKLVLARLKVLLHVIAQIPGVVAAVHS
jgi:hypothetical protein